MPKLVSIAESGSTISYTDLADFVGMPNPRNLNYVLLAIGLTMEELSIKWGKKVPPIQYIVVNKAFGLPGIGIDGDAKVPGNYKDLTPDAQNAIIQKLTADVTTFSEWRLVLKELGLQPINL